MALKFSVRSGALPANATVAGFRGSEGISRPYVFDVYVNVLGDTDVEPEDAVGSKATLVLEDGGLPVSSFAGILSSFEVLRAVEGNTLYKARIVPQLWQLSLTKHSRIFTKKTAPEVIEAILEDEGIADYELRLNASYDTEEHICQYKESSLDFIQRWMEREGMYYFFEQTEDGEKLVIADHLSAHQASPKAAIPYHPTTGKDQSAGAHFDLFTVKTTSLPAKIKLMDYDYAKPALDVSGSANVSPNGFGEVRDYGVRFFSPADGARMATLRAEELRAQGATCHAEGAAARLSSGFRFLLSEHPRSALNKEYLATAIEHFGFVAEVAGAWGNVVPHTHDDVYRVEVSGISADLQYRHPCRTPWPRVDGYENGVVDGPATSEYAQIDDLGRYNVKFKFDEGTLKDGKASTFVRMMQPHAGAVEGWHFPLRKGTEVVFLYLGGDPDRPVIAGAIPNAVTPSPVTSGNHTKNVIQTGGRNRFELEDLSGQQRVTLSTPYSNTYIRMGAPNDDHEMILKTDDRGLWFSGRNTDFRIHGFWDAEVGEHWDTLVCGYKKETIQKYVEERFESTKKEDVLDQVTETYKAQKTTVQNLHEEVDKEHKVTISDNETVSIGQKQSTKVGTDYKLEVGGNQQIDVTGNRTLNVTGNRNDVVVGNVTVNVSQNYTQIVQANITQNVTSNVTVNVSGQVQQSNGGESSLKHWDTGYCIGLKFEGVMGAHIELNQVFKLESFIGVKIGLHASVQLDIGAIYADQYPLKAQSVQAKLETGVLWMAGKAVNILQGMKII